MNVRVGYKAIRIVDEALDGIPWWLEFGGLIGLIRERRLLPWDRDIDIGIRAEDLPADIIERLDGLQYVNCHRFSRPWTRNFVGPVGETRTKLRFRLGNLWVVIHVWFAGCGGHADRRWTYRKKRQLVWMPRQFAEPGGRASFRSGVDAPIPTDPDRYLTHFYGRWKTPRERYMGSAEHRANRAWWITRPTVVLTCGVFDLLHRGHIEHLHRCRDHGEYLVVAVQEPGGKPAKALPVMSLKERMAAVTALDVADEVVSYRSGLDGQVVTKIRPDVLCHGPDWLDHDRSRVIKALKDGRLVEVPRTPGISTTEIRGAIVAAGNPD